MVSRRRRDRGVGVWLKGKESGRDGSVGEISEGRPLGIEREVERERGVVCENSV